MQEFSKYLNTEQVASFSGISTSTLTKLRLYGGGPKFFKVGRRVVYLSTEVESWIEAKAYRTTSEYVGAA